MKGRIVYIEELKKHVGEEVEIRGWVYNKRSSGKVRFVIIRDGTGFLQCVMVKSNLADEVFELYDELSLETSVIVKGKAREDRRAPGGVELELQDLKIMGKSVNFPIPKVREDNIPDVGVLLPIRHLWLRTRKQWALMRIRHTVEKAIHDFFDKNGFIRIDAPILTPSACEGTTTLFETDYFGEKAYLTQSGQLYMEAACMAHGRVYCFGPTFRAEKSKTRRHLMEFWMVEPEIAYAELPDIMENAERFVSYIVERVLEERKEELKTLERDISKLEHVSPPFPKISYTEAVEILKKKGFKFEWGDDFGGDEETAISEEFDKPVIVHRYPAKIKAFYMKRDPQNPELALCMDMLAPEGYGEIIGGGQREDSLEELEKRFDEYDLPKEAYEWYLDLRRYGTVPHAGYGLGIERTIAWISGIRHVREAIPFPRLLEKIYP
ncbi:MAG TPA: asparagine--tRNA ligase [candidate division WOR-3 bacterium]|uniref:Asparagine--tRNA ligase n=1 Tax=candidate division WOR-3 bacterium TaxID=2052148 RepID=A0A7V0LUB7_UNCW3|nr:asparagine--tRNA ligase [candidate division WOR-3 bacterium]